MNDAWLLGVAIFLTLLAGVALSSYESYATRRGLRFRRFERPGAAALVAGFSLAALFTGKLGQSWFVLPVAAFAALSGTALLRRGGRLASFMVLWIVAIAVVFALGAQVPAYGVRGPDVVFTALLLACFTSLIRELDIVGSVGWITAAAMTTAVVVAAYALGGVTDGGISLLLGGALFAVIALSPFGAGLLGRTGSRLTGLVIGALAIRAAVDSPLAMAVVAGIGLLGAVGYLATLESRARRPVVLGLALVAGAGAVVSLPAVAALVDVYRPIQTAVASSRALIKADAGQLGDTGSRLAMLKTSFAASADRLDEPAVKAGLAVPFLSANLRAATLSTRVASDLTGSARRLIDSVNVNAASMRAATVDRRGLKDLSAGLRAVQDDVRQASERLGSASGDELLVQQLRNGVGDLRRQLRSMDDRVSKTLQGAGVAELLLSYDRPRRFFIAVQNNAESRATGGYIANYGILVADQGRVTLTDFRRTSEFDDPGAPPRVLQAPKDYVRRYSRFDPNREWTNVNMSPDLPTVARVIANQYAQFSGTQVDGVIAVDPVALSSLLRLTGPVRVADWPTPIDSGNVVQIALHDEYIAFDKQLEKRIDFLGDVAKTVFERLTNGGLGDLVKAGTAFNEATVSRHLQLWSAEPAAQRFFAATNSDGAIGRLRGDSLMVTTQNAAGNKLDFFLRREVAYDAKVTPTADGIRVDATVTVKLRSTAPSGGQPKYVIGPFDQRFTAGQNRLFLTVYSPLSVTRSTLDGAPLEVDGAPELGRLAHSAFVDVPAGATRTVQFKLDGLVAGGDSYRLDIVRQPLLYDDDVSLRFTGLRTNDRQFALSRDIRLILPLSDR